MSNVPKPVGGIQRLILFVEADGCTQDTVFVGVREKAAGETVRPAQETLFNRRTGRWIQTGNFFCVE